MEKVHNWCSNSGSEGNGIRPVARIFRGGGGGGAYLKNRDQIINARTIRYASSADTQRRVSNLQTIKLKLFGTTFNGTRQFIERRKREALGWFGGMPHRRILNLKALKGHFQHSQADSCVKKVPKIDYFLLNFDKTSVVIICIA